MTTVLKNYVYTFAIFGLFVSVRAGESEEKENLKAVCSMFTSSYLPAGTINLEQSGKTLTLTGSIKGLPTSTFVGMHVHEFGDFSNATNPCDSTGPHFNPFNKKHGCPSKGHKVEHHAGDFGSIQTDSYGNAQFTLKSKSVTLNPGKTNVLGRAIVIHMDKDDCGKGGNPTSLINGNSGKRIVCGAIGVAA